MLELALGHDPARREGVYPDSARTDFAGERPGESQDAAFGGDVASHGRGTLVERDRCEIHDGAPRLHGCDSFSAGEEIASEIEGEELIPVPGRGLGKFDARIARGVIDQGVDWFSIVANLANPSRDLSFAQQIDFCEVCMRAGGLGEVPAGAVIDVAEVDLGPLSVEGADHGCADAVGTAGDEDDLVTEFWKDHAATMPQSGGGRK